MGVEFPKVNKINDLHFFGNNPSLSYFLNTLSTLFDKGERYFMKSITAYLHETPGLKEDIISFVKEERLHSQKHNELNASFDLQKLTDLEQRTGLIIELATKFLSKRQHLIATAALEHITFCLASNLLERTDLLAMMPNNIAELWTCHAIDETSYTHATIAYRILDTLPKNKTEENLLMVLSTVMLVIVVVEYWIELMLTDTKGFKKLPQTVWTLLSPFDGFITGFLPHYFKWYKKDFTPEQAFS